jgi:hypothetical protein
MGDNLVVNNSAHNFSTHDLSIETNANQTKVVSTPGTDAAILTHLRSQLESGTLTSAGNGINAEYSA